MKVSTIEALDRINRCFYSARGLEFSVTREKAWPAWERVLDRFAASRPGGHASHSILDVGCGNGRFAKAARDRLRDSIRYTGIDASLTLASIARREAGQDFTIFAADLVNRELPFRRLSGRFDLVAAFGLMHHVPSWERRRSLLVELAGQLAPGGLLAVSFWQFGAEKRFSSRFVAWNSYNRTAGEPIDADDLEPGDHLLRWGEDDAIRYCHWVDPVEAADLTSASGLQRLETFHGDGAGGRLNLYHLLQRTSADGGASAA